MRQIVGVCKVWTDSRDVQVAKSRDSGDGWDVGGVDEGGVRMMARFLDG